MDTISFTIGIPTVNKEFISEALSSALNQTYTNYEIVILNNAKTNEGKKAIKEVISTIDVKDRIRYFENNDQIPMVDNWNKLLNLAKNDYFLLLSDDDTIEKDFLKEIARLILKYPNNTIFKSRIKIIDEDGEVIKIGETSPEEETAIDFFWNRIVNSRNSYISEYVVRTKDMLEMQGFVPFFSGWGSDIITWFKIITKSDCLISTNLPLANHRVTSKNASTNSNIDLRIKELSVYNETVMQLLIHLKPENNYEELILDDIYKHINVHFQRNLIALLCLKKKNNFFEVLYTLLQNKYKLPIKKRIKIILC